MAQLTTDWIDTEFTKDRLRTILLDNVLQL